METRQDKYNKEVLEQLNALHHKANVITNIVSYSLGGIIALVILAYVR